MRPAPDCPIGALAEWQPSLASLSLLLLRVYTEGAKDLAGSGMFVSSMWVARRRNGAFAERGRSREKPRAQPWLPGRELPGPRAPRCRPWGLVSGAAHCLQPAFAQHPPV